MKKRKKSNRKKLVEKLDKVYSLYIRALYPICVFCGSLTEHCFHFMTRAKYATRWDVINGVGSCRGCNFEMEFNPHPYVKWFIDKYGLEEYNNLIARSNVIPKYSNEELEAMIEFYEKALAKLEKGTEVGNG